MFIVTKKIDSENISKVCRTCLREDNDKMVYLFVGPAKSSLGAKLQSLSCLKVSQGDGLPEKMCDKCVIRAESALLFREQCCAADKALKQALITTASDYNIQTYAPNSFAGQISYDQQSQSFGSLHNSFPSPSSSYSSSSSSSSPASSKISNHNKTATDYQEFHEQNQLSYPVIDEREKYIPQLQPHILKSCSTGYLNFNYSHTNEKSTFQKPDDLDHPVLRRNHLHCKRNCTSQCLLCNHTFSNQIQLVNYDVALCEENCINLTNGISFNTNNEGSSVNIRRITEHGTAVDHLNFAHGIDKNQFEDASGNDTISTSQKMTSAFENENPLEIKQDSTFKCETCFITFNKKSKLITHQAIHSREKAFQCTYCWKSYSSKNKLSAHVRLHTQTNVHQCDVCKKTFAYPSYLREHMKTHCFKQRRQTNFECTQCNKRFLLVKSYTRHMKFHTGKDLYHCDVCNKLFSHKNSLKIHMRSHESAKSHKCDICDKAFNQKSNLVEHIRTHTKIKPFKCEICEKSFVQSSHLKSHRASHDSIRSFQCRLCGKKFKLPSHLKRHINLHTALKTYKCEQCNQMFSQSFSLQRHLKRKHK